jgi:signal transduction histidine kinase
VEKQGIMMKKDINNQTFNRIYCISGILYLVLFVLMIVSISSKKYHYLPFITVGIGIISIVFLLLIKSHVIRIFRTLSHLVDLSIEGKKLNVANSETELSLLASKLDRFTKARNKEIQENVQQREQIESLVSDISHQTKTAIASLVLYSNLLQENISEDSVLVNYAGNITKQAQRLKWLIQTLIHMSHLENNIIQCTIKSHKIDDVIIQSINRIFMAAKDKNQNIIYKINNLYGDFDIKWTCEAITNILDNSIKYTPAGGEIEIRIAAYEQFICICIADNGIGIPKEEYPMIFKRFYRGINVSDYEGIGVGLYLTRKIISLQKGYVKVKSVYGQGSEFYVYLPKSRGMK